MKGNRRCLKSKTAVTYVQAFFSFTYHKCSSSILFHLACFMFGARLRAVSYTHLVKELTDLAISLGVEPLVAD